MNSCATTQSIFFFVGIGIFLTLQFIFIFYH